MPQGDLVFFPYDATVVLLSYLGGYTLFVGWLAPRVVLTFKARAWTAPTLEGAGSVQPQDRPYRFSSLETLAAVLATPTSEVSLAFVQFTLLALLVYRVGRTALTVQHPVLAARPTPAGRAPSFGVPTVVATNLVTLWTHHRSTLFVQPAAHALAALTVQALHRLQTGRPPRVLPRLLGVVRSSTGLGV